MRKQDSVYTFDQFFTRPSVAELCANQIDLSTFESVIEPSAGQGAFFDLLPPSKRVGIEIDPRLARKDWICGSWYDYTIEPGNHLIIGNPPFGTQNSEAIRFFNHAALFADTIAFIIPRTWKRVSVQNALNLQFHLQSTIDLDNAFEGEKATSVKCCFQVWKRGTVSRKKTRLPTVHRDWKFLSYEKRDGDLHPPEAADFVMLAYGSNPGQISDDLFRWRPKSVHFIKAVIDCEELKTRFKQLDYSIANDSARQSSLGKGALVQLYGETYDR